MRLFHVSESSSIARFVPRIPLRADLDKSKGLVWALGEDCLPNFLTPRECPRVTYRVGKGTTEEDITRFFSSSCRRCVAIEHAWFERMRETTLYIYEFDPANFYLQDACAGYYVSERIEVPVGKTRIDDLFGEMFKRGIEVRLLNNLWLLRDAVVNSTLRFSICDMANAQPRPEEP
ncbi:MAG: hypothetical protein FWF60_02225 [Oscillospiraceae bacterium]|nr:hypothetical protein [Oscillospiraceae bacterium]